MNKPGDYLLVAVSIVAIGSSLYSVHSARHSRGNLGWHVMAEPPSHGGRFCHEDARFGRLPGQPPLGILHDALQLSAAQEPAWKTLLTNVNPAERMPPLATDETDGLSVPERLEKRLAMLKQHEDEIARRLAVIRDFYVRLTPPQQRVFNDLFQPPVPVPPPFGHP